MAAKHNNKVGNQYLYTTAPLQWIYGVKYNKF